MQVKSKSGRAFDLPSKDEAQRIREGISADSDTFTHDDFKNMRLPGRPKAAVTKRPVSIRLSPEVDDYFRATGKGWQTRIDDVLKAYVAEHHQ
jgi:uncharacterized protein (DUF4415 family)